MIRLLATEMRREVMLTIRYPLNALVNIALLSVLFYAFFLGASYMAGSAVRFGERLDGLIVGYVTWLLATDALMHMAGDIEEEAMAGTLESLFLSCYGITTIFFTRALSGVLQQLVLNSLILFSIMALTGRWLTFSPQILLPLATVVATGIGMGFAAGGVALLVKRSRAIFSPIQYGFLFLMMTPFETWEGSWPLLCKLLPFVPGVALLRQVMAKGGSPDPATLAAAVAGGLIWFTAGIFLFRRMVRAAKMRGLTAGY